MGNNGMDDMVINFQVSGIRGRGLDSVGRRFQFQIKTWQSTFGGSGMIKGNGRKQEDLRLPFSISALRLKTAMFFGCILNVAIYPKLSLRHLRPDTWHLP
jgi:hypothetical protein